MFVDSDLLNFNRWQDKAMKGEPKLPEPQSALEDAPQRDIVAGGASEVRTSSRVTPISSTIDVDYNITTTGTFYGTFGSCW